MKCEILLQVKLLICTGKQNATIDDISGGYLVFEIIWQTLNYLRNIPMKHSTQKKIPKPINMYGTSFNISFTLSNALLNERLS